MKTRFTLTSLALASLMMMSNAAMADVVAPGTSQFFNVKLKVTGSCEVFTVTSGKTSAITADSDTISGADIDFGSHLAETNSAELSKENEGKAGNGIQVACSKNTAFQVALEPSNNSEEGTGAMSSATTGGSNQDQIAYQLFKPTINNPGTETEAVSDSISANKWGKGANALSLLGKGTSTPITLPVFAKIATGALTNKTPDLYQDHVKVTLTY